MLDKEGEKHAGQGRSTLAANCCITVGDKGMKVGRRGRLALERHPCRLSQPFAGHAVSQMLTIRTTPFSILPGSSFDQGACQDDKMPVVSLA